MTNTVHYIVCHGPSVVGTFRVLTEAAEFAERFVDEARYLNEHVYDTYVAVVLYDDFRYSAGG